MQTTTKLVEELTDLEHQYWQAIKDRDVEGALRLTDDPVVVTGSQGVGQLDRRSLAGMMEGGAAQYTLESFRLDDVMVSQLTDDVAVVAYKVHEELTVRGERVALDAADSSTWVRRDGRWRCATHTESVLGDPFGRDRRPPA